MKMYKVKAVLIDQETRREHLYTIDVPSVSEDAAIVAAIQLARIISTSTDNRLKLHCGKFDATEIGPSVFN